MTLNSEQLRYTPRIRWQQVLFLLVVLGITVLWASSIRSLSDAEGSLRKTVVIEREYLISRHHLSIEDVLDVSFNKGAPDPGSTWIGRQSQWYSLKLSNRGEGNLDHEEKTLTIAIDLPIVDYIAVYGFDENQRAVLLTELGEQAQSLTAEEKMVPHFQVLLPKNEPLQLLILHKTLDSPSFPLFVVESQEFEDIIEYRARLWWGLLALAWIVVFYHAVLMIGTRDRTYISYIVFTICSVATIGTNNGFFFLVLPSSSATWAAENAQFFIFVKIISATVFIIEFFRIREDRPRAYSWLMTVLLASLVVSPVSIFLTEDINRRIYYYVMLLSLLVFPYLVVPGLRSKLPWTITWFLNFAPYASASYVFQEMLQGTIAFSDRVHYFILLLSAYHYLSMTIAIVERVSVSEESKLYHATHDAVTGLGTGELLLRKLTESLRTDADRAATLRIVSVEITNFDEVSPFLDDEAVSHLIRALAGRLAKRLEAAGELLVVDDQASALRTAAQCRSDVITFTLYEREPGALAGVLSELDIQENHNPLEAILPYRIECKVGVALHQSDADTASGLLNESLLALKMANRDRCSYYIHSEEDSSAIARRIRLAQDLDHALVEGGLSLYFQPQLNLKDPTSVDCEALLRWRHIEYGFVNPEEIVLIAENTGLIHRLTEWVIEEAFQMSKALPIDEGTPHNVSINVSAFDLSQEAFSSKVISAVQKHNIAAKNFTFELTETASGSESAVLARNVLSLNREGARASIDDFGTGYAALSYAAALPVQELKLDRSFVARLCDSPSFSTVIQSVVSMAKDLNMSVTAEGVEDANQARILLNMGCDHLQGYWISRPLPSEEYMNWVANMSANQARLMDELQSGSVGNSVSTV